MLEKMRLSSLNTCLMKGVRKIIPCHIAHPLNG